MYKNAPDIYPINHEWVHNCWNLLSQRQGQCLPYNRTQVSLSHPKTHCTSEKKICDICLCYTLLLPFSDFKTDDKNILHVSHCLEKDFFLECSLCLPLNKRQVTCVFCLTIQCAAGHLWSTASERPPPGPHPCAPTASGCSTRRRLETCSQALK